MNNRGFTLIELITSIVILALVLVIAVPSISNISTSIRQSQRKNLINEIEIAAAKYAFDTGETLVFVDNLVTEGYMESDDENNNVIDPADSGQRLNCYLVKMEKEGNYYKATFQDGTNYDTGTGCNMNELNQQTAGIDIKVTNPNGRLIDGWYVGNDITLTASSNSLQIDCEKNHCIWTSSSGAREEGTSQINLKNVGFLITKYTFQMTSYGNDVKRYSQEINLKIDNEPPVIYPNEIKVTDRYVPTNTKTVTIEASDIRGSGINGYYLSKDTTNCTADLPYQGSNKFVVTKKGTYLVCVKDKVGNISSYNGLVINYLPN